MLVNFVFGQINLFLILTLIAIPSWVLVEEPGKDWLAISICLVKFQHKITWQQQYFEVSGTCHTLLFLTGFNTDGLFWKIRRPSTSFTFSCRRVIQSWWCRCHRRRCSTSGTGNGTCSPAPAGPCCTLARSTASHTRLHLEKEHWYDWAYIGRQYNSE